jgi:16S rRNA (cytidine1402-2'-O)-methyltransferase
MTSQGKLFLIPNLLSTGTINTVLPCNIKETVDQIEYFFAEDLRTARRFLSELKVSKKIEDLKFYKVDKDTSSEEVRDFFKQIPDGKNIGVVSEAGCPCIADPGSLAVYEAHQLGMEVVPIVGPSSILLALIASGLNGQSFVFHGYLPIEKDDRSKAIKSIEKDSLQKKQTQIFMETPYRNNKLLEEVIKVCSQETKLCIASNLTASDQFIKTQTIKNWKNNIPDLNKRPSIFLLLA